MYPLRAVMLSSFAYFSTLLFDVSITGNYSQPYFICYYILLKCVKFAMFYLLYICQNAKEKENQTEINKSNQIKSKDKVLFEKIIF